MTWPVSNQPTHIWLTDSVSTQQADLGLPKHISDDVAGRTTSLHPCRERLSGVRHHSCDDLDRKGSGVPECDNRAGFGRTMLTIDRTDITADRAADEAGAGPAGVALVPIAPQQQQGPLSSRMPRPDPSFVAHLIATAEQAPQTRRLRRAAPQEALSAYAAHLHPTQQAGRQTRQSI